MNLSEKKLISLVGLITHSALGILMFLAGMVTNQHTSQQIDEVEAIVREVASEVDTALPITQPVNDLSLGEPGNG